MPIFQGISDQTELVVFEWREVPLNHIWELAIKNDTWKQTCE